MNKAMIIRFTTETSD